ncbi:MAG: hypothetical protein IPH49_05065 [Ignavibacteria bacterium]|nr:hypothetical protein [Ignavibacteria bacterium]
MRQLLVYIAFAILADQLPLHSQPIDGLLPGLSWVPNSWGATVAAPTIVQPQTTGFVIGWNWAPPYSPIGRMIRGTHFHVGDAFDDAGNTRLTGLQRMMRDCHVAGAALIPAVRGISDGIDGTPLSSPSYSNPGAAIGIEYAPWIDFNTATNDVVLNSTMLPCNRRFSQRGHWRRCRHRHSQRSFHAAP